MKVSRPTTWRHLNFFQHECYLHARVPRIKRDDGCVRLISPPWSGVVSGFTLLFEALLIQLCMNNPRTRYHFSYFLFPRGTTLRNNRNVFPDFCPLNFVYQTAIKNDLPIGSGQIESAHRYVIQSRLKFTEAWWRKDIAENISSLRTLRANNLWKEYLADYSINQVA